MYFPTLVSVCDQPQARSLTGSAEAEGSRDTTPRFDLISLVAGNLAALLLKMVPGKPKAQRAFVDGERFTSCLMGGTIGPRAERNRQCEGGLIVGCLPAGFDVAIARLKRGRRPADEEVLKMSCSRGCASFKLYRRCRCFCHFGWRGQLPPSTLPPWPRMKLLAIHGRHYSQTEFALNSPIRAQAVVFPGSAALVTTPLRLPVTRASFESTPTPGL